MARMAGPAWRPRGRHLRNSENMRVGVVVERRRIDHPWQEYSWRPVEIVPGAPTTTEWRVLPAGGGRTRSLAGAPALELSATRTEGYRFNLSQRIPVVFVVLRRDDGSPEHPYKVFHATVDPAEAQEYLEGGEDLVEGVPMPDAIVAWMRDYIARHHVEAPFQKRRRKPRAP